MRNLSINTDFNYDYNMSQFDFDDNFKILNYSGFRQSSLLLYTEWGDLSDTYNLHDDIEIKDTKFNRTILKKYLVNDIYYAYNEIKDLNANDLLGNFIDNFGDTFNSKDDVEEELKSLNIDFTNNYQKFETIGYSQGDYSEILVNKKELIDVTGRDWNEALEQELQTIFKHLCWDAPIYGKFEISFDYHKNAVPYKFCEEFDYQDWANNSYEIDIDSKRLLECIKPKLVHELIPEAEKELVEAIETQNHAYLF